MKNSLNIFFVLCVLNLFNSYSQEHLTPDSYFDKALKADSIYYTKTEYKKAYYYYNEAFKIIKWSGFPYHQLYAAVCCSEINNIDSAFAILERITYRQLFSDYESVISEKRLEVLKKDKRWLLLLDKISKNKKLLEKDFNLELISKLDSIRFEDGKYRGQFDIIKNKYGIDSKELMECKKMIFQKDSINSKRVELIIDKHGWLGEDIVGYQGNKTLFIVIQHSRFSVQKKYLPILRQAVKNGNALAEDLAFLEDRVSVQLGKKQKYGSQVNQDHKTLKYFVEPLEDPDNVDKLRAEVGLSPLAEYVKMWGIKWNLEQYKKDLSEIEKILIRDKEIK